MIGPGPDLRSYDVILVSSSGGKDSAVMLFYVSQLAWEFGVLDRVHVAHATFREEWPGTVEVVRAQAELCGGLPVHIVRRRTEDLLDYVRRRKMWPGLRNTRYCTSDFKRAPIDKLRNELAPRSLGPRRVLNCMGMRAQESPARSKLVPFTVNKRATNSVRHTDDWLPIFRLTTSDVWEIVRARRLPMHYAYGLGMPRLSCRFCIFAPKSALVLAGHHNLELLREYVAVEDAIGHRFRQDLSLRDVLHEVEAGRPVETVEDWRM